MSEIALNLRAVRDGLPAGVELVAVSKYHPEEAVRAAYEAGQRTFGESREQELARKHDALPADISWHFIGHLQTNKVRFIVPYIAMIESVDSLRLLREINKQALRCGRVVDVLLELHLAQENTKTGLATDDCRALLDGGEWRQMEGVRIRGIMAMATDTDDVGQIEREFLAARDFFVEAKARWFADADTFDVRSWGMSHDYETAIACGANCVRIGSRIFGPPQR